MGIGTMPEVHESVFVAEGAMVVGDVSIGPGSSVWYNAVIRGDMAPIRIGERTNVQDCAVLHVDTGRPLELGSGVTVGHGAILHGCSVGDNTMVGMGAIVLNGACIGRDCIIGAGTLITQGKEVPDGHMVFGNPARVVRELTPDEIERNRHNAATYVEQAKAERGGLPRASEERS